MAPSQLQEINDVYHAAVSHFIRVDVFVIGIVLVTALCLWMIPRLFETLLHLSRAYDRFIGIIVSFVRIGLLIGAVALVIHIYGFDLQTAILLTGTLGLAVGQALASPFSDLAASVRIHLTGRLVIGERIEYMGTSVLVRAIGAETVTLVTPNRVFTVPSSYICNSPITHIPYVSREERERIAASLATKGSERGAI